MIDLEKPRWFDRIGALSTSIQHQDYNYWTNSLTQSFKRLELIDTKELNQFACR